MIRLTPKSSKIFPKKLEFVHGLHQAQTLILLITLYSVLEKKTNVTTHPNICSFKTAIEDKWNEMSEEFILKECKLF